MSAADEKLYDLIAVRWEGRIHCVYLNGHRVAGGKPWGGGDTAAQWKVSLKDLASAIPEIAKLSADKGSAEQCLNDAKAENLRLRSELGWIARHRNDSLTNGSAPTRACLDAIVARAEKALSTLTHGEELKGGEDE